MKYKSYRIIDGKPKWVIVDKNRKIINKKPSREELNIPIEPTTEKYIDYSIINRCDICEKKLSYGAYRERDNDGNLTGRYTCQDCYEKYNPNSGHSKRKLTTARRTGTLDPNSSDAKGDKAEELTCRWRGVKNLNKENDNYHYPIDHSRDSELGIIQTKSSWYDYINMYWLTKWDSEWNKEFNNLIYYCIDRYGKRIEKVFIFPKEEVLKRTGICVRKKIFRGIPWYERFRLIDVEVLNEVKLLWKQIIGD